MFKSNMILRWRRAPRLSPLSLLIHHWLSICLPGILCTSDTADIADLYRDFSVDVTSLASVSISGMDVTSGPDLSVAASMSAVDSGAY